MSISYQNDDWGQFVIIHPEMYEYKQQISKQNDKILIKQNISRKEEIPIITQPIVNANKNDLLHKDFKTYKEILFKYPSRFIFLCTVQAFNYMYTFCSKIKKN